MNQAHVSSRGKTRKQFFAARVVVAPIFPSVHAKFFITLVQFGGKMGRKTRLWLIIIAASARVRSKKILSELSLKARALEMWLNTTLISLTATSTC